jgi:hypothetical protein
MKSKLGLAAAVLALCLFAAPAAQADTYEPVELVLGIMVDVSSSVIESEFNIQRQGYVSAFANTVATLYGRAESDPDFHMAPMAVNLMYWAVGQETAVDWTYINSAAEAQAFAAAVAGADRPEGEDIGGQTDISEAINYGREQINNQPFETIGGDVRKIMDVSGDGWDNVGNSYYFLPPADLIAARDATIGAGIVINGLPILTDYAWLDTYFADYVIGGNGAFLKVANDFNDLARAINEKVTQEVTGLGDTPEPGSLVLFGSAAGLLVYLRRRKMHKAA